MALEPDRVDAGRHSVRRDVLHLDRRAALVRQEDIGAERRRGHRTGGWGRHAVDRDQVVGGVRRRVVAVQMQRDGAVELVVAPDHEARSVGRAARSQRDVRRRADGEVRDLHHRPVVDGEQDPIAHAVALAEVAHHHGAVVAAHHRHLVVGIRRRLDRWEGRTRVALGDVGTLHRLDRVGVRSGGDPVVVDP